MASAWVRAVAWMVLLALLVGCGRASVVRRETGSQPPARAGQPAVQRGVAGAVPAEAVVARGETLYGIAFRHGLDYRQVASWNGIAAPFTIYPGQRIRLQPPGGQATASTARQPAATPSRPAATSATRSPASTPGATRAQASDTGRSQSAPAASASAPAPAAAASTPAVASGPVAWRWPADGQIVGRFAAGDTTRQGIDIAGQSGQEVRAAADGVVVYSGSGLVGYGELIIVKHTDEWLSAYGHNRRRLVEEGQAVRGGQQIAEMGRSGASRDMLHFEIRRNGRPVDPLQHLPRR